MVTGAEREIYEASNSIIIRYDNTGVLRYINKTGLLFFGYTSEELIGRDVRCLIPNVEKASGRDLSSLVKNIVELPAEHVVFENENITKEGKTVWIAWTNQAILNEQGEGIEILSIGNCISALKESEEKLAKEKALLRSVIDSTEDLIYFKDRNSTYLGCNKASEIFTGITEREQRGKTDFDFFDPEMAELIVKDDQKVIESNTSVRTEEWVPSPVFGKVLLDTVKAPIYAEDGQPLGLVGISRDITERKQIEEKLIRSQQLLTEMGKISKVGGWEFDIDTGEQKWTEEVHHILEVGFDYVPNVKEGIAFYSDSSKPVIAAALKRAIEHGEPYDLELEIITAKGNLRNVHAIGIADLEYRRVHGIFQDITERKSNEVALLAATQAAEAASRAKNLFLAKMSHELRTPMTAIIGFGELLEEADLTPEHKRYLAAINTSGKTLSSLIDDVLALSKVEAGGLAVKTKEFRLHKLITNLVATQERQIAKKNLSFNISIDSDVPDSLIGDPQRIQQVLLNLLGNAIKFTEKGDIGIAVSVVEENNLRVLLNFAVRDTGIGISTDRLGCIFEPFAQALGSSHDNYGGSGLGLTISRSLAGLMGGTVSVESQKGIGSTFRLLIPLQKKHDNITEKPLPKGEPLRWSGPTLTVLLAEDNSINSQFIKAALENMGHVVTVAENGKIALDILKENTFDLVLMDIQMPVMNGDDVLSVIRELEQPSGKHQTVVALTAYALIGDKERYLKMGFDSYLSKPLTTKALIEELVRIVPS